ncbi:uncharacterized protein F5Z01DRAFT_650467 [Emericellopsis atlantica]|uniref:BHLH domain-containing protein n=1 Tax=Emericellopsis atlantica TaxID=2614577 RepID=A0A9P7ZPP7_9HYPO|nr:uncharacterized protein F5Z01DRAFT_650467 [Emericellopsis atlantica]KAG9255895.1 hypothetical protein F5Z01DRAFT_650467 [Emericellopsis atlantica]
MASPARSAPADQQVGNSSKSPDGQDVNDPNSTEEKARLTVEEKKQNHINSEHKRRQNIRDGFDRLCEIVPGLEGQGRSEGLVLKQTIAYMREQIRERRAMIEQLEAAGETVDPKLIEPLAAFEKYEAEHKDSDTPELDFELKAPKKGKGKKKSNVKDQQTREDTGNDDESGQDEVKQEQPHHDVSMG